MPEVETMVRDLTARVVGRTVTRFEAPFFGSFVYPPSPSEVESRLVGQQIVGVSRRGKYAGFALASGDALIIHRGMTGSLLLRRPQDPPEGHVRLIFGLDDDAELRFNDPRKFGKAFLMEATGAERPLPWQRMGPEPLNGDFTPSTLRKGLEGRTATIKPLLLNQQVVAGLGNIYVDEALYRARIHPERRADTLRPAEIKRLHGAIQEVLQAAIEGRGTTFSSYTDIEGRQGAYQRSLQVFQRAGQPCERCGSEIVKLVVGGRGTHVCPSCQRV